MKNIICIIFGHKPKESPPLIYFRGNIGIPSKIVHIFCERCGSGEVDMMTHSQQQQLLEKWRKEDVKSRNSI